MSEDRTRSGVDPNAEREVDLRSGWARITARWWLPVGGLFLGAILGVLVSIGSGDVFKAEALIYLGQPFTPARRRPDPEPPDEPEDRERDHPQRGRDESGGGQPPA